MIVNVNKKHNHTFGCPVYVLENALGEGKPFRKWNSRSKVGIFIGQSSNHNERVALVLDRKTGSVSPQYHVQFDDGFTSVSQDSFDSDWLIRAGFVTRDEDEREKRPKGRTPLHIPGIMKVSQKIPVHNSKTTIKRKVTIDYQSDGANKRLRRPPGLHTGSDSIEELSSMQVKIASEDDTNIKGEIFAQVVIPTEPLECSDILAMKSSTDPDIIYFHQALKQQ